MPRATRDVTRWSPAAAFAAGCPQPLAWPERLDKQGPSGAHPEAAWAADTPLSGYSFPWGYLLEHKEALGAGGPPQAIFWEFWLIPLLRRYRRAQRDLLTLRGTAFETAVRTTAALPRVERPPSGVYVYCGSGASAFGILAIEDDAARDTAAPEAHARRWMRLVFLPRVLPQCLRAAEQALPRRRLAMGRDETSRLTPSRTFGSHAFTR
jgi:hypothetical protein